MGELTDLFFTSLGKVGRWYNIQGQRICFVIWTFVMFYWIARNLELGLLVQTGSCIFSLAMHLYGYFNWKKKEIGANVK